MSDDLIRWAPLAIVLIGLGIMIWAAVVMRREEKESQGIPRLDIAKDVSSITVGEGDTIVLRYEGFLSREQRQVLSDMVVAAFPEKKVNALVLCGGLTIDAIVKEARPTSDAADFGGIPG